MYFESGINLLASIQATINSQDFSLAAKRLDVWHEGCGIGRWELELGKTFGTRRFSKPAKDKPSTTTEKIQYN